MFSGIVETTGLIAERTPRSDGERLAIATPLAAELAPGQSIAVNGACLTVVSIETDQKAGGESSRFTVDLSAETLRRTTFGQMPVGRRVNLERAVRVSDRLDGHIVTGHVDATGVVAGRTGGEEGAVMTFKPPARLMRYIVEKGSIAVDGVSLTVADLYDDSFTVALIPFTLEVTALGELRPGDAVNLEADILGKYVERLLSDQWLQKEKGR